MVKTYTLPNGDVKHHGDPVILEDVQYGPNWLEIATPGELDAHGIAVTDVLPSAPVVDLERLKSTLANDVQIAFDAECAKYVTPGWAMRDVYRVQLDAAFRCVAAFKTKQPLPTHPSLASLVGILAADELGVANIIMTRNEQCEAAISTLNAKRLIAKDAILKAQNEASARQAANVIW